MSAGVDRTSHSEVSASKTDAGKGFNPDRRIDILGAVNSALEKVRSELNPDKLYTTREKRISVAARTKGEWSGAIGDSKIKPDVHAKGGEAAVRKLAEYGMQDIEYKNGVVDFSRCSVVTVEIKGMTSELVENNYPLAFQAVADKWNAENPRPDGKLWTKEDVKKWKKKNKLVLHECNDMKTVQFVPAEIHEFFKHSGGRAECKAREDLEHKNSGNETKKGSGFDD